MMIFCDDGVLRTDEAVVQDYAWVQKRVVPIHVTNTIECLAFALAGKGSQVYPGPIQGGDENTNYSLRDCLLTVRIPD